MQMPTTNEEASPQLSEKALGCGCFTAAALGLMMSGGALWVALSIWHEAREARTIARRAEAIAEDARAEELGQRSAIPTLDRQLLALGTADAAPSLVVLRAWMDDDHRLIATLHNTSAEYVAVHSVAHRSDSPDSPSVEEIVSPPEPSPLNESESVPLNLREVSLPYEIPRPVIIEPGEIINLDVHLSSDMAPGELVLRYSGDETLRLGPLRLANSPEHASQPGSDAASP